MDQHAGTGHSPVHHDYDAEQRYALTNAGHALLAPTGDAPAPGVVLSCGWTFSSALTVAPSAGGAS